MFKFKPLFPNQLQRFSYLETLQITIIFIFYLHSKIKNHIFESLNKYKQTKTKTMKNLIETTTGTISSQMILNHCGYYAGRFQDEAFDLLSTVTDLPEFEENQWCDIMFDRDGDVYAIWAEDSLTCSNADAKYIQLDREDCPSAFSGMEQKINS